MSANDFAPRGLELLCDRVLLGVLSEYDIAMQELKDDPTELGTSIRNELTEAIRMVEEELKQRGLDRVASRCSIRPSHTIGNPPNPN
jgi:ATP-dependent RNA circularization protein (DNA/RNA ligase family)